MVMVVWVLVLCWDQKKYAAPSRMTSGTRTTRGFTGILFHKHIFFNSSPTAPGTRNPAIQTSTRPRPQLTLNTNDYLLQGWSPYFSVYLLHLRPSSMYYFGSILIYLENGLWTNYFCSLSNHQQFYCHGLCPTTTGLKRPCPTVT